MSEEETIKSSCCGATFRYTEISCDGATVTAKLVCAKCEKKYRVVWPWD